MHNYSHKLIKLKQSSCIIHRSARNDACLSKDSLLTTPFLGKRGSKKTIEDWVGIITHNSKLIYYDEQDNTDHNG